ncbi:MAG: hypothetical protein JXA46_00495 [Dehalococcoidales bacterium]|nr:hypothetical protein [Dehalococcoidales bacterium]
MEGKDRYNPDVYKRLDLVRKQFQAHRAEQRRQEAVERKQEAAERRQERLEALKQNRVKIGRIAAYTLMGIVLLSVIGVAISGAFR